MEKYYLGLDVGTESIGWAVTDEDYNIKKFKGKSLWGIRLFDEAGTAAERRVHRSSRRRGQRKKRRIELLQELFATEINKVDPGFYQRLRESKYWMEDKTENQSNTLFFDKNYDDKQYHKDYPTIYHLRQALLESDKEFDVRLVYLGVHNIIKHRGHFLFEGEFGDVTSLKGVFQEFCQSLSDNFGIELVCNSVEELEQILKDKKINKSMKKSKIIELCSIEKNNKQLSTMIGVCVGLKGNLNDILNDDELKNSEFNSINFSLSNYDKARETMESELGERSFIIDKLKTIYDWSILAEILEGGQVGEKSYLSVAKVNLHKKHEHDLKELKSLIKQYCTDEQYKDMFLLDTVPNNYSAYVGLTKKNGKNVVVSKCSKEGFYDYVKKCLKDYESQDDKIRSIFEKIEKGTFMPRQSTRENGVIPYQVHEMELKQILKNASDYLKFLNESDQYGTVKDKIEAIFKFRIPYYIGPINDAHKNINKSNCWFVRKEEGRILPWNFFEKVDEDKSATEFIRRMTNKCTYLYGKDVIPKQSLLYSEFMVLNEINNIKIRGEKLPVKLKQKIVDELFKNNKKVTLKMLKKFIKSECIEFNDDEFTGLDLEIKASMTAYVDFSNEKLFGNKIKEFTTQEMVENIINWITLYGDDNRILKRILKREYGEILSEEQMKVISKLKYSAWGRFSKELLQEVQGIDIETGEIQSIIQALRNTSNNFMELLSGRYTYIDEINKINNWSHENIERISYDELVAPLYVSPKVKRPIWQTIKIIEEIKNVMGCEPTRIFIEMARGSENKGKTTSRKESLIELYKSCKNEEREWIKEIESIDENKFQDRKLYLYYTQMAKCLYTGKQITLDELYNKNQYDKDHIYPQSKTKDDSIHNNLVLVDKTANKDKDSDIVPIQIQKTMEPFWRMLKNKKLINEEKYNRLTRKTPLTDEELSGFINRQLVETRQSTKILKDMLNRIYGNSEVVCVKAQAVSDFRNEDLKILKVRNLNDYHHAKDAYLNIVVGNVYYSKFTSNPLKWIKTNKNEKYSLKKMFSFDIERNGKFIWKRGNDGTIKVVDKNMKKNNILFTRYAVCEKSGQNGGLFNQQLVRKSENASIKIKSGSLERIDMDVEKYGGYKSETPAYFVLVEGKDKKGTIQRIMESVPLYKVGEFEKDINKLKQYCSEKLGLKDVSIRIPKIKKNSKIIINGFPMHLKSSTGKGQLGLQGASQLILDEEKSEYVKKVGKYVEKNSNSRDKNNVKITEWDGLSYDENIKLYDVLLIKHKDTIYKRRPAAQIKTLEEGRDKFKLLTVEEQCISLNKILSLFSCRYNKTDLRSIGGSKDAGTIKTNRKISEYKSVILVNQSITGIFEQEIDLLTI